MIITTVLAFIVTLGVLIVVHEYGHYLAARACGVKVLRFSIGFGPVLWRRQPDPEGTEFALSAIPFGGYVAILDERLEPVPAAELPYALSRKPLWQRMVFVLAGPFANFVLAIVLYSAAMWIGMDEVKAVIAPPAAGSIAEQAGLRAGDWLRATSSDGNEWNDVRSLADLRWQLMRTLLQGSDLQVAVSDRDGRGQRHVTLALKDLADGEIDATTFRRIGLGGAYSEPVLGAVNAGGAGAAAGLRRGDRVLAIDGRSIVDAGQVRELIRASGSSGKPVSMRWRVEREGTVREIYVTPAVVDDGKVKVGKLDVEAGQRPETLTVRYGFVEGAAAAVVQTWQTSVLTVKMIVRMLTGRASIKNLSGPLSIADYAGQSVRLGFTYYLGFLAVVSVSLGVLNLLPLPVLDGGQLMYYLFEAVTGSPVAGAWLRRLQLGGFVVILAMMSLALYNDWTRLTGQQ